MLPFRMLPPLLCAIACICTAMADEQVLTASPPAWISPSPELTFATEANNGGHRYHLVDFQHHLETNEQYSQVVVSIINQSGVQTFSKLDFDYVPDYQQLTLHHITITRKGETQDRLKQARIETLRREQGMSQNLYDGELTALIILEDIRPGDVLSYAYTVKGNNPALHDIHHKFISTGYSDPVDHLRRRVLWSPEKRSLQWLTHGPCDEQAQSRPHQDLQELLWEKQNLARITPEENTPSWHDDYPSLEYSDCKDWQQFGTWATALYARQEPLPAEAARICEEIRSQHDNDDQRIAATLEWVQTHIRYLGSFFGEHTHEPYPLEEIWRRQFGDCKDKTMLTIAMLRHLGYDAAPALVNSDLSHTIGDCLPGPSLFNHVVVHLRWQDEDYYLDPTRSYQRGPLKERSNPDYGYLFQIRPDKHELTRIGPPSADAGKTVVRETYKVEGMHGGAGLLVETTASGEDAISLRSYFASSSSEEINDAYRKFYANDFPEIESTAAVEFHDDQTTNVVTVRERYRIPEFWLKDEAQKRWHSFINSSFLRTSLVFPKAAKRKHPYHHRFPHHVEQVIRVELPEPWAMETTNQEISDPAFVYRSSAKSNGKIITLSQSYHSLANHVEAAAFPKFVKSLQRVENDLSTEIWHYKGLPTGTQTTGPSALAVTLVAGTGITGLLTGLLAAMLLWFWNPAVRPPTSYHVSGIGGWLILPIIGLVLTPPILLYQFYDGLANSEAMTATLAGLDGFSSWHLYFGLNHFSNGFLLATDLLLLVLLISRRSSFP